MPAARRLCAAVTTTIAILGSCVSEDWYHHQNPRDRLVTILIAVLAHLKRGDTAITRWDWIFFVMALSSLPFWYYTEDPLWAVIILTVVDTLGFGPTIRRTYHHPHSESLMFYSLFTTRNLISIFALETYSVTTILFPAVVAATCLLFVVMAMIRRRSLAR